jgi:phospholipid/cholesterol/gamma-HCH transport system ATP-binding protein
MNENVIEIEGLKNRLGGLWVHNGLDLTIKKGEILAIIGGSGSGKTTLLRCILMLLKPTAGTIRLFGKDISQLGDEETQSLRRRWGTLFQHSALFSSMTTLENIMFPMQEFTFLNQKFMQELAMLKLSLTGLPYEAANKFPSELSGGMQRRAATARAIAMDPELLFLDEPTTGLDPVGARKFDDLVVFLRDTLSLTIVMISHDVDSLKKCTDRVAFIGDGKVLCVAPLEELRKNPHPLIVEYFKNY